MLFELKLTLDVISSLNMQYELLFKILLFLINLCCQ
jgi:hypothetical protein